MVLGVLSVAMVLLASNRVRIDIIGLLVLVLLGLTGHFSPDQLFSGFSSEAVVLIAAMLALGEAMAASGIHQRLAELLETASPERAGRLITVLMLVTSLPAVLMTDVGLVGIFIPVVKDVHRRTRIPVRRLLLPMAVAATLGGHLTMVSSTSNIVGNTALKAAGIQPFSLFQLAPLTAILLAAAIAFSALVGWHLIPGGTAPLESEESTLRPYLAEFMVLSPSPLAGKTLEESPVLSENGITVVRIERDGTALEARRDSRLKAGDVLLVVGRVDSEVLTDTARWGLALRGHEIGPEDAEDSAHPVELLVGHRSSWAHHTVRELNVRHTYGASILGIYREGHLVFERLGDMTFEVGDVLLVQAASPEIALLKQQGLLVPLEQSESKMPAAWRLWATPVVMGAALLSAALGLLSIEIAVAAALVVTVLLGLLDIGRAYRAIEWRIVVFVGGMAPLGTAMVQSGVTSHIAHLLESLTQSAQGPWLIIAVLFVITAVITQMVSNVATVVLLTPIAIDMALKLGVHPYPLVAAILSAVAASPLTPLTNKQTLLIMGPGGYSYGDFLRFGMPFTLVMGVLATLFVPVFFPLH